MGKKEDDEAYAEGVKAGQESGMFFKGLYGLFPVPGRHAEMFRKGVEYGIRNPSSKKSNDSNKEEKPSENSGSPSQYLGSYSDSYHHSGSGSLETNDFVNWLKVVGVLSVIGFGFYICIDSVIKSNEAQKRPIEIAERRAAEENARARQEYKNYIARANNKLFASKPKSPEENLADARKEEITSFEVKYRECIGGNSIVYNVKKENYPELFNRLDLNGDDILTKTEHARTKGLLDMELIQQSIVNGRLDDILNNFVVPNDYYPDSREINVIYDCKIIDQFGSKRLKPIKKEDYPEFFNRIDLNGDGKNKMGEFKKCCPYFQEFMNQNKNADLYRDFVPPQKLYSRNQKK